LDFDGKSHAQLLVSRCEVCLHSQLTDSPQTLNLRTEPSIFSKHCVLLGIFDDAQKSFDIFKIYSILRFLGRQNYLNICSSGMLSHVDC